MMVSNCRLAAWDWLSSFCSCMVCVRCYHMPERSLFCRHRAAMCVMMLLWHVSLLSVGESVITMPELDKGEERALGHEWGGTGWGTGDMSCPPVPLLLGCAREQSPEG